MAFLPLAAWEGASYASGVEPPSRLEGVSYVEPEFVRPAGLAGCAQGGTRTLRTEEWVDLGPNESVAMPGGKEGLGVYLSRR